MRRFYVTLVSHCEKVWWDPGYESLRAAVDAMVALQERLAGRLGQAVASTFCTFVDHLGSGEVVVDAAEAPDVVERFLSGGNELGLHVHAPTSSLASGAQDRFIPGDARRIAALGLPPPTVYTAGDFVTSAGTVPALEEAGIGVDCSVYSLDGPLDKFGVHLDYRPPHLMPYRASRGDLCLEGGSRVVELPVSGGLLELAGESYPGMPGLRERVLDRYQALGEGVDVFQVFWHPFEIATLDGKDTDAVHAAGIRPGSGKGKVGVSEPLLSALEELLGELGRKPDVEIAGAGRGAAAWLEVCHPPA